MNTTYIRRTLLCFSTLLLLLISLPSRSGGAGGGFVPAGAQERIILLNEGNWQADNGRVTYFENGRVVSNQWFRDKNGQKLGDTPNDIIQVNDQLIAIALNWSNIIQFIRPDGTAVAATEDVPNNRKLCTDGRYVYVSSYGHECGTVDGMKYFTRGYVAKIDTQQGYKVVAATEVGYEPEGIALYRGHLFVANTGGYAFQEDHEYETTVSVLNAETMQVVRTVDTHQINLYGKMSQSGQYLCINSPGDYYDIDAACIIFDCEKALQHLNDQTTNSPNDQTTNSPNDQTTNSLNDQTTNSPNDQTTNSPNDQSCFVRLPYAATYNCTTRDGHFYAIGSRFSYYTSEYTFNFVTIDPARIIMSRGDTGYEENQLPGTMVSDLQKMGSPYGIYVNPYTGYIYATDAGSFAAAGQLYQWSPEGQLLGKHKVYINPAHFLALPPDGMSFSSIRENVKNEKMKNEKVYDLQGRPVATPQRSAEGRLYPKGLKKGQLYVTQGRKYIK